MDNPVTCQHVWGGWVHDYKTRYAKNACQRCCVKQISQYHVCELVGNHVYSASNPTQCQFCYQSVLPQQQQPHSVAMKSL